MKLYSVNRTINSILSMYEGKAAENEIDFSVRCNAARKLKVREIDLIALLGNLLENVLHGCQESGKENKRIEIHIRLQNKRLIILCNNTCSDDLDDVPDTITVSTDLFSSYAIAYVETEGAGADNGAKCGLCHICPTFLGICYFIWLAIGLAVILIIILVVVNRRKRSSGK